MYSPRYKVTVSQKTRQCVSTVLYACVTDTPLSRLVSPLFQSLVDAFDSRVQFSNKTVLGRSLLETYEAVCHLLRATVNISGTGSLTADSCSAALGAPILRSTWNFVDLDWRLRSAPISTISIGDAAKRARQLRFILEQIL